MKKTILLPHTFVTFIFALVVLANQAAADVIIDMQGVSEEASQGTMLGTADIPNGAIKGIVFSTGATPYTLTSIRVPLSSYAGSGSFDVLLYAVDNSNTPTTLLTSQHIIQNYSDSLTYFYTFNLTNSFALSANTKYSLSLGHATGPSNYLEWKKPAYVGYPPMGYGGVSYLTYNYSQNNGTTWTPYTNNGYEVNGNGDWGYKNFIIIEGVATVPEPSTYALLCISLGVVGFARKRMKKDGINV